MTRVADQQVQPRRETLNAMDKHGQGHARRPRERVERQRGRQPRHDPVERVTSDGGLAVHVDRAPPLADDLLGGQRTIG